MFTLAARPCHAAAFARAAVAAVADACPVGSAAEALAPVELPDAAAAAADEPRGCGWYESSHALQHGMQVIEHRSFELMRDLPLGWQLAAYFTGEVVAGTAVAEAAFGEAASAKAELVEALQAEPVLAG